MNITPSAAAVGNSSSSASDLWKNKLSNAEGIAWCSAYILTSIFIVIGNLITIVLFVLTKRLRKKSLFLVINMAFADLMLGSVSLPVHIYIIGVHHFQLWKGTMNTFLIFFYIIVDTIFLQASTISAVLMAGERFYAVYWPLKHRTLTIKAYRVVIAMAWITALSFSAVYLALLSFMSRRHAIYTWIPYALTVASIICSCNIAVWRKFRKGRLASQQQMNRSSQNRRLTKTLLLVSILSLLSWLPLSIVIFFIVSVDNISPGTLTIYYLTVLLNYSNSFINPVVYALRISEFKQALGNNCFRTSRKANNINIKKTVETRSSRTCTLMSMLSVIETCPSQMQLAFEQDVVDTKL
ncbi:adenosine receptor A3-like [Oculina patagonica]